MALPIVEKGQSEFISCSTFHQVFKPLFYSMRLFGLHFKRGLSPKGGVKWTPGRVYSTAVLVVSWISFCWTTLRLNLTTAPTFDEFLINKMSAAIWCLLCSLQGTSFHISSFKTFVRLGTLWDELEKSTSPESHRKLRRSIWMYTLVGWTLAIGNVIMITGMATLAKITTKSNEILTTTMDHTYLLALRLLNAVISIWLSASWIFPSMTNLIISNYLRHKYTRLNHDLRQSISQTRNENAPLNLQHHRTKHEQITKVVQCADQALQMEMATLIIGDITIICFGMYVVIWYSSTFSVMSLCATLFWMACAFIVLFKVTYSAYRVNSEVRVIA